jgi:hypothetical protein
MLMHHINKVLQKLKTLNLQYKILEAMSSCSSEHCNEFCQIDAVEFGLLIDGLFFMLCIYQRYANPEPFRCRVTRMGLDQRGIEG